MFSLLTHLKIINNAGEHYQKGPRKKTKSNKKTWLQLHQFMYKCKTINYPFVIIFSI